MLKKFLISFLLLALAGCSSFGETRAPDDQEIALITLVGTGLSLTQLESDKQTHAYIGMVAGGWATLASKNAWVGTATACTLGLAKEIYDNNNQGTVEAADFVATCVPGAVTSWAVSKIIKFHEDKKISIVPARRGAGFVMGLDWRF